MHSWSIVLMNGMIVRTLLQGSWLSAEVRTRDHLERLEHCDSHHELEAFPLRQVHLIVILLCGLFAMLCFGAQAQDQESIPIEKPASTIVEKPDRYFDLKVPEGFNFEPPEELGIFKWKKDSAEIHAVVGDLFDDSPEVLFKALQKGAETNKRIEQARTLRIKGGHGLLYKEKAPEDAGRLRLWRLLVVTNKKMINIDFIAPEKDFGRFAPDFENAVKSFKLKSS